MQARGPLDNLRATESSKDEDAIEAALKNPPPGGWLPQGVGGRREGGKEGGREDEREVERGGGGAAKTEAEPAFQQEDSSESGGGAAGKEEGVEKKRGEAGAGQEAEHVAHCLRTKGFQVKILPRYSRNSCNSCNSSTRFTHALLMLYTRFTHALLMLYTRYCLDTRATAATAPRALLMLYSCFTHALLMLPCGSLVV